LRRIATLIVSACLVGSGLLVVAPAPALACDATHPCGFMRCHVNAPEYDPATGVVTIERPIECYY
jgi:hypothetical protein